jgi:hypothetical protein
VNVYDTQTRAVIGQIFYNYISYSFTSATISTWAHQLQLQQTSQWGQFVSGTTVDGNASCTGACSLNSSRFPAQPVAQDRFDNGESYFNSTSTAPGVIGSSTTTFTYTFHNPAWDGGSATPGSVTQVSVRCDNALPGVSSAGCVFPLFVPVLNYAMSGLYPQLAQHIQDAQASGLPGSYPSGSPLTRLTDAALLDQNRRTACPSSYPRPPGYTCDEYPFASSQQGAYLSGGGPRTFSYCQISLQDQSTGSQGYSVCMIDADQNSGGGRALLQFYNANRVIDSDPFYVWITA